MRFVFGLFLLLFSSLAIAADLCWEAPTENVDGSPLTDLVGFRIYRGDTSRNYTYPTIGISDPAETCYDHNPPLVGTFFFAMTAMDFDDNESAFSNEVLKTLVDSSPLPPIILVAEEIVFTVIKQPNRFLLLPIGTVPAGTICDPNNSTNGHGAVPTADVVWTSPTGSRPIVVVALCAG